MKINDTIKDCKIKAQEEMIKLLKKEIELLYDLLDKAIEDNNIFKYPETCELLDRLKRSSKLVKYLNETSAEYIKEI